MKRKKMEPDPEEPEEGEEVTVSSSSVSSVDFLNKLRLTEARKAETQVKLTSARLALMPLDSAMQATIGSRLIAARQVRTG